jgi:hypothetical protein
VYTQRAVAIFLPGAIRGTHRDFGRATFETVSQVQVAARPHGEYETHIGTYHEHLPFVNIDCARVRVSFAPEENDTVFATYTEHRARAETPNDTLELPVMLELLGDVPCG